MTTTDLGRAGEKPHDERGTPTLRLRTRGGGFALLSAYWCRTAARVRARHTTRRLSFKHDRRARRAESEIRYIYFSFTKKTARRDEGGVGPQLFKTY